MEKTILKHLQPILPSLVALSKKKKSVYFDYDKQADVLYVSFAKPQQATDTEILSDDILIRKKRNEIVGITLLHASHYH